MIIGVKRGGKKSKVKTETRFKQINSQAHTFVFSLWFFFIQAKYAAGRGKIREEVRGGEVRCVGSQGGGGGAALP